MPVTPEHPQRLLCFDFGTRQIGVACGQTLLKTAQPVAVLSARDGHPQWHDLLRLISEWQPDHLLVGLPLNMDGTESDFCRRARKFARRLHARSGLPVIMVDERLSTAAAKMEAGAARDFRRHPVDGQAAALILGTWLSDPDTGRVP